MAQSKFFKEDLYNVLGVHPKSDATEIRSKYRQSALKMHPDKGGRPESFHLLTYAFEILSCQSSRLMYDRSMKLKTSCHSSAPCMDSSSCRKTMRKSVSRRQVASVLRSSNKRLKRPAQSCSGMEPPSKYQHVPRNPASQQECIERLSLPLSQLRVVLQEMKPELRQASIQTLSPKLRSALTVFMRTHKGSSAVHPKTNSKAIEESMDLEKRIPAKAHQFGFMITKALHICTRNHQPTYKAHVHIKALRFYTHGHPNLEVALDRQMILVQLRQALSSAGLKKPHLWEDAHAAHQICIEILKANETSESEMGLSSYVYMRAGHVLVQNCTIISPVMPLKETLELHCRLLRARQTSWQALRAEWVELMQSAKQPPSKRKTLADAEAIADEARTDALKIQFARATKKLAKAVELHEKWAVQRHRKMFRKLCKEQRKATIAMMSALASRRRIEKHREDEFKFRRKWFKRLDLTMEDIMRGPPPRMI